MFRISWIFFTYRILAVLIVLTFICLPLTRHGEVQRTEANTPVIDNANLKENLTTALKSTLSSVSDAATAASLGSLEFKDYVLDPLAWALVNTILRKMTGSIVTWINSGFQGSPAFVTDLEGFLIDVADETAGEFIYGTDLGVLCSPFELDVRIALAIQYDNDKNYNPRCTLSDVSDNIEGFINGSFTENGGWPAWFELTTNEVNHPTGAYFDARAEFSARIRNAQGRELTLLDWGEGFFSFEACRQITDDKGNQIAQCEDTTPGSVIQEQLNETLTIGGKRLVVADEIDEIVGALMAQLAQQAITGAMGLLGLGGNSSYSDRSFGPEASQTYLEAMAEESDLEENSQEFVSQLTAAQDLHEEYIDLQFEITERIGSVLTELERAESDNDISQSCFNLQLPSKLENELRDAVGRIETAEDVRSALIAIENAYISNPSDENSRRIAIEQFAALQREGLIPNEIDILQEEQYIENELVGDIQAFRADISAEKEQCRIRNSNGQSN